MKHSRLVLAALTVFLLGTWATLAFACESKTKVTTAAASTKSSAMCTPAMAAQCTPEMAAACKAKGATATAVTASASGCAAHKASAVTASATSGCGSKTRATAVTAAAPAKSVDAVTAGAGCGSHGAASAVTAAAPQARSVDAVVAGAGGSCSGHGASKSAKAKTSDCDGCADMAFCEGEAKSMGATVQVVPLKNGVMYVYTAIDPGKVHAVQASMERRSEHMASLLSAGDKAHLCPTCKSVRGAIASGKLNRELVNIEGGCLTLMTSNDPTTLAQIYTMAGIKSPASAKS